MNRLLGGRKKNYGLFNLFPRERGRGKRGKYGHFRGDDAIRRAAGKENRGRRGVIPGRKKKKRTRCLSPVSGGGKVSLLYSAQ